MNCSTDNTRKNIILDFMVPITKPEVFLLIKINEVKWKAYAQMFYKDLIYWLLQLQVKLK